MNKDKFIKGVLVCVIITIINICLFGYTIYIQNKSYDISEVDVFLQVDSDESYYYARDNGLDIAKFFYKGTDITDKKKGFSIGYSYDSEHNEVIVYLMQKGKTRELVFNLDYKETYGPPYITATTDDDGNVNVIVDGE